MPNALSAVGAVLLGCIVIPTGCSQRTPRADQPFAPANVAEVRILASARDCDKKIDGKLLPVIKRETPALADAFRSLGLLVPPPIFDPSADALLASAAPTRRPLIVVYSGHGRWAERATGRVLSDSEHLVPPPAWQLQSVVCLSDGPFVLDRVVQRFGPPTPGALFVINACYSANVDARLAGSDLSVLSGSTRLIAGLSKGTPLGQALIRVLGQPLDTDKDSYASDIEIFMPLVEPFRAVFGEPDPKLRRQLQGRAPLFVSAATAVPVLLDTSSQTYVFGGRQHIRLPGRTDDAVLRTAGIMSPDTVIPVPCQEPVGQCFALAP